MRKQCLTCPITFSKIFIRSASVELSSVAAAALFNILLSIRGRNVRDCASGIKAKDDSMLLIAACLTIALSSSMSWAAYRKGDAILLKAFHVIHIVNQRVSVKAL